MMIARLIVASGLMLLPHCARDAGNPGDAKPAVENPRVEADAGPATVSQSFDAAGITTVILRAANAPRVTIRRDSETTIEVSGKAQGGAGGYHSPDPNWRETPAAQWGLGFVAKRFQNVLVISSRNELHMIHHSYYLDSLVLSVPANVEVIPAARELNGSGEPDLRPSA